MVIIFVFVIGAVIWVLVAIHDQDKRHSERCRWEKDAADKSKEIQILKQKLLDKVDGRFITYDNGTVLDTKNKLMWAAKDNGTDINWANAKNYCENYRGGGYTDWRMPTQDELVGLYESGNNENVIQTTWYEWTSETRGSDAVFFGFNLGDRKCIWAPQSGGDLDGRALPVRSGK